MGEKLPSRGVAVSSYLPCFADGPSGAKIYGSNIQSGEVTSAHIAAGTVVAADVKDGAITSSKIGAAAVVSAKIGAGAVKGANIAANAVTSAHIASGTLVGTDIKAGTITSAQVSAGAVVESKLNSFASALTIISAGVTYAVAHGLGAVPALVSITPKLVEADAVTALSAGVVGEAAASAATSTNIYVIGNKDGIKYSAFVLI